MIIPNNTWDWKSMAIPSTVHPRVIKPTIFEPIFQSIFGSWVSCNQSICFRFPLTQYKTISTHFIYMISPHLFSAQINTNSIAAIMIKLIRKDRDLKGSSFLHISKRCKKASKNQLNYTLKYQEANIYSHCLSKNSNNLFNVERGLFTRLI